MELKTFSYTVILYAAQRYTYKVRSITWVEIYLACGVSDIAYLECVIHVLYLFHIFKRTCVISYASNFNM